MNGDRVTFTKFRAGRFRVTEFRADIAVDSYSVDADAGFRMMTELVNQGWREVIKHNESPSTRNYEFRK